MLAGGEILFLVSCNEIIGKDVRDRYMATLVIHASDLPKGRGWSPHIWQIIEGKKEIMVSLLEAEDAVDSGAIWAKKAWGHYWSWAPLEAWSLLSYLLYVFYLHVRRFLGWKMKRTAWIAAFGLVILTISYWGMKWLAPSLHPGP